jgi:hypothetical protein
MALYRSHLHASGHTWREDQMALMLPMHVAPTSSAARETMRAGVEQFYRSLLSILSYLPATETSHRERLRTLQQTVEHLPFARFCREQGVFGDPAECIDRLQAARDEFGLCQIICWFDQGGRLPMEEVKRTMAQFADNVMPRL